MKDGASPGVLRLQYMSMREISWEETARCIPDDIEGGSDGNYYICDRIMEGRGVHNWYSGVGWRKVLLMIGSIILDCLDSVIGASKSRLVSAAHLGVIIGLQRSTK